MYLRGSSRALRGFGSLGVNSPLVGKVVGSTAPIAAAGAGSIAAAAGLGAAAGPIGAAVGALVGVIGSLFAASAQRAAGAKDENSGVNEFLPAFDQALQQIFQEANAGTITGAEAASLCPQILQQWWAAMAQFKGLPGVKDASDGGANCGTSINPSQPCQVTGGPGCSKSCTAGCCVGCYALAGVIAAAVQIFSSPTGGTLSVCSVSGSGYGATGRPGYSLTYTPPAPTSAAGIADSTATTLESGTIAGIPIWMLALGGIGAYLALR